MASVCRRLVRHTLCSLPFLLGLSAGFLLYFRTTQTIQDNSLTKDGAGQGTRQEASLLGRLETNINLLKDTPPNSYIRPRFIRDEINITDQLFFGVVYTNSIPKNFLKYQNLTTSRLTKKFVLFLPANASDKSTESYEVRLENMSMKTIYKYLDEHYQNYLYYYLVESTALVNGDELSEIIEKLHFKTDFYLGYPNSKSGGCDLSRGILLHSQTLGSLVNDSVKTECTNQVHGVTYSAVTATREVDARNTYFTVISHLTSELEYQSAARTILRKQISKLDSRLDTMDEEIEMFIDESDYLEAEWPEVVYKPRLDLDRLDNDVYEYINSQGQVVDNNPSQVAENREKMMLESLMERCNLKSEARLSNAWKKVNYHNGIDYTLNFAGPGQDDKAAESECSIHQEVSEPILVSLPFVTESTKISLVVPVSEQDRSVATTFLKSFAKMCLERNDRVFLMLVFLYTRAHPEKNNNQDFYKEVKQTALQFTKKYKKKDKGSSILWYSLQTKDSTPVQVQAMDLLIQKLDSQSIILVGSPYMELHNDYLNRVRMNTIEGRLVFSPIPYTDYNPQVLGGGYSSSNPGFNASSGHFDAGNYDHISFYKSDYMALRPNMKSPVIMKETDLLSKSDLKTLPSDMFRISGMFESQGYLRGSPQEDGKQGEVGGGGLVKTDEGEGEQSLKRKGLHVLRAPEPSLRLRYRTVRCEDSLPDQMKRECLVQQLHSLGSRNLLATIFLKNNLS